MHSSAGNHGAAARAARSPPTGTGERPRRQRPARAGCAADARQRRRDRRRRRQDLRRHARATTPTLRSLQWSEPRAIFPTAGQGGFTDLNLYVINAALTHVPRPDDRRGRRNGVGDTIEHRLAAASLAGTTAKLVVDVEGTSTGGRGADASTCACAAYDVDRHADPARAASTPTRTTPGSATSSAALDAQNVAGALEPLLEPAGPVQLADHDPVPRRRPRGRAPASPDANARPRSRRRGRRRTTSPSAGVGGFGSPFTGTSAAAPHAAGCDALLRDETEQRRTAHAGDDQRPARRDGGRHRARRESTTTPAPGSSTACWRSTTRRRRTPAARTRRRRART